MLKILSVERKSVFLHVHVLMLIVVKMNLVMPATPIRMEPVSIVTSVLLRPITAVLTPTALILMAPSNALATKALNGSMKMIIPRAAKISTNATLLKMVSLFIDVVVMLHVSTKTVVIRVSATVPADTPKLLTIPLVLFHVMISMNVKKMPLFVTIMLSAKTLMDHTTVSVKKVTLSTSMVNTLAINSLGSSVSTSMNAMKPRQLMTAMKTLHVQIPMAVIHVPVEKVSKTSELVKLPAMGPVVVRI